MPIGADYVDPKDGTRVIDKINYAWICRFTERFNIFVRMQTLKKQMSPSKTKHIEKSVPYHLGQVKRDFETGVLEDIIENNDETHFVINMDNGRALGFAGDDNVKYADVVSGGEGITMILRLTGGKRAQIKRVSSYLSTKVEIIRYEIFQMTFRASAIEHPPNVL